jgi:hypothetical protein
MEVSTEEGKGTRDSTNQTCVLSVVQVPGMVKPHIDDGSFEALIDSISDSRSDVKDAFDRLRVHVKPSSSLPLAAVLSDFDWRFQIFIPDEYLTEIFWQTAIC